ncbi:TetR/AcrR family transcriptional regulator [Treponema sp.]|uniref:TetR/AcrR family transcriptional regulator n=1 Tax=Treponema sp. TaxID=166 RepID=UPI003FD7D449
MTQKTSTKQLILDAAFSFYKHPCFKDFSMSQLAAKVGISKTAIYRHFKNKDAVVESMKEQFFDILYAQLSTIQNKNLDSKALNEQIIKIISFFAENSQYINYFITLHAQVNDFEKKVCAELRSKGLQNDFDKFYQENKPARYSRIYFCAVTILYFIKLREKAIIYGEKIDPVGNFSKKMVNFIQKGIVGTIGESSQTSKISKERFAQLDEICKINEEDLPEEDKIFTAFSTVITKYGINNVTVEHIADELNIAKSSLYFYFENKNKMLLHLVAKELSLLGTICEENCAEAKTYTEFIYINMKTEISYFSARPSILSLCGWLLQNGAENSVDNEKEFLGPNNVWETRMTEIAQKVDLGFSVRPEHITIWSGLLPISLTILKIKHEFSDEETNQSLNYMFDFLMYGAKF